MHGPLLLSRRCLLPAVLCGQPHLYPVATKMTRDISFDCPSCGAPVTARDDQRFVECQYCGNNLLIPEELRAAPPRQQEQYGRAVVINIATAEVDGQLYQLPPVAGRQVRRRSGCGGVLVFLLIVTVVLGSVGAGVWAVMEEVNPGFLSRLVGGGGYAQKVLSFGGRGKGPGMFSSVVDIAVDGSGDIYVAERDPGRVQRFDKAGTYLNGWVIEGEQLVAIAADRATSTVYVVSGTNIYKYEGTTGQELARLPRATSDFFATQDVAVLPNGDILTYVSGKSDDLVRRDTNGGEVARFPGAISGIYGGKSAPPPWQVRLAADSFGAMFVLHEGGTGTAEVIRYNGDGSYASRFGGSGNGEGQFSFARALAVDGKERIYVCDVKGIQAFDRNGKYLGLIKLPLGQIAESVDANESGELFVISNNQEVIKFKPK